MKRESQNASMALFFSVTVVLTLLWGIWGTAPLLQAQEQKPKPLQYKVDVKATLVPFFILDKKGNPVFDVKKEDLELYVDNKPMDIYEMMAYRFDSREEGEGTRKELNQRVKQKMAHLEPRRVIFLVVDSMNNTFYGIDKSKRIVMEMIRKSHPEDRFVILEVTLQNGLKYIAGPEPGSPELLRTVKKMKLTPGRSVSAEFFNDYALEVAAPGGGKE